MNKFIMIMMVSVLLLSGCGGTVSNTTKSYNNPMSYSACQNYLKSVVGVHKRTFNNGTSTVWHGTSPRKDSSKWLGVSQKPVSAWCDTMTGEKGWQWS